MTEDRLPGLSWQTGILAYRFSARQARRPLATTAKMTAFRLFVYPPGAIRFVISTASFNAAVA